MPGDILSSELRRLAVRCMLLDLAAYLISVIVLGVTLRFALGLLLGTAVLFVSLLLLKISVIRMSQDARRSGATSTRRFQLFYVLRLAVFGAAFALSLVFPQWIHPVGTAVPMLFPRLIYTAGALFGKSESSSDGKKR